MIQIILLGMLGFYAVEDIRKKKISAGYLCIFAAAGIGIHVINRDMSATGMLLGAAVGLGLVVVSLLTRGSVGLGDGFLMATAGIFLGGSASLTLLMTSLLYAALFSLAMVAIRKWKRKREIPFVPFLFLGYLTLALGELFLGR